MEFNGAEINIGEADLKTGGVTIQTTTDANVSSREELIPVSRV